MRMYLLMTNDMLSPMRIQRYKWSAFMYSHVISPGASPCRHVRMWVYIHSRISVHLRIHIFMHLHMQLPDLRMHLRDLRMHLTTFIRVTYAFTYAFNNIHTSYVCIIYRTKNKSSWCSASQSLLWLPPWFQWSSEWRRLTSLTRV